MITIDNLPGALIFLILIALGTLLFLVVLAARRFSRPNPAKPLAGPSSNTPTVPFGGSAPPPSPFRSASPPPDLETGAVFVRTALTLPTQAQQNAWDRLPPRQKEAAVLVASGLSTRQVAGKMHIQTSTVQGYLKETYAALDVRSRTELVNFVRDISLETPPPHRMQPP